MKVDKLTLPRTNGVMEDYNDVIPTAFDAPSDQHLLDQLNRSESPFENFKPKRANQILQEVTSYIENFKETKSLSDIKTPASPKIVHGVVNNASRIKSFSAAKIHGIDVPMGDVIYSRKPHKLEALNLPMSNSANEFLLPSHSPDDLIENLPKVEKKFNKNILNPL